MTSLRPRELRNVIHAPPRLVFFSTVDLATVQTYPVSQCFFYSFLLWILQCHFFPQCESSLTNTPKTYLVLVMIKYFQFPSVLKSTNPFFIIYHVLTLESLSLPWLCVPYQQGHRVLRCSLVSSEPRLIR